jgi:hypothetical protein
MFYNKSQGLSKSEAKELSTERLRVAKFATFPNGKTLLSVPSDSWTYGIECCGEDINVYVLDESKNLVQTWHGRTTLRGR